MIFNYPELKEHIVRSIFCAVPPLLPIWLYKISIRIELTPVTTSRIKYKLLYGEVLSSSILELASVPPTCTILVPLPWCLIVPLWLIISISSNPRMCYSECAVSVLVPVFNPSICKVVTLAVSVPPSSTVLKPTEIIKIHSIFAFVYELGSPVPIVILRSL